MPKGLNKVALLGNLTADPEMKYTGDGTAICKFRMATSEKFIKRDGNEQTITEYHNVVAWGKLGEACGESLSKGSLVYVEGSLRTRKWDDQDGKKRYMTEINAREVLFLDPKGQSKGSNDASGPPLGDDDIPF